MSNQIQRIASMIQTKNPADEITNGIFFEDGRVTREGRTPVRPRHRRCRISKCISSR